MPPVSPSWRPIPEAGLTAMTVFDYSVFGLRVRSSLELPELFPAAGTAAPDITIDLGSIPEVSEGDDDGVNNGALVLAIPNVARYRVEAGNRITVDHELGVPERNVRLFLLGSAFGVLLHQRGLLPLHANAIEIDGRAVAFMGPSGAGKSTLAAWFHDHGFRVLADDVCVIGFDKGQRPYAAPGPPRLRLWPEGLRLIGRETDAYPHSYVGDEEYDKLEVPIDPAGASTSSLPLVAVYVLERADEFGLDELFGVEAAQVLFANTYRGGFVSAVGAHESHWRSSIDLVRSVPTFRIKRSWNLARLDDECRRILDQVRAVAENVSICVGCGLCCDGTLHSRTTVKSDDEARVVAAGLQIEHDGDKRFFRQPCRRFGCGTCTIYEKRPAVCQTYRCKLLESLDSGGTSRGSALDKIRIAKSLIETVRHFCPEAGTPEQRSALARGLKVEVAKALPNHDETAKALLNIAVLERFLNRWFLGDDEQSSENGAQAKG